jgi:hypothetical protein
VVRNIAIKLVTKRLQVLTPDYVNHRKTARATADLYWLLQLAYSVLACFRMGMSASALFYKRAVRTSEIF